MGSKPDHFAQTFHFFDWDIRTIRNSYYFFFTAIILLFSATLSAQPQHPPKGKQIVLKGANTMKGDQRLGYQRLIGNVIFEHEGALLTCDSAHLADNNTLDAFGNVHIKQGDTLQLSGDQLHYDGNTRQAVLTKNVSMQDHDMLLTTDQINYDRNTGVASYSTGGKIVNKDNTLTSKVGYYSSDTKTLSFKNNVVLVNPQYTMTCDTLRYLPGTKVAYFLGPTNIKSAHNTNSIYCENGFYDTQNDICQFNKNAIINTKDQQLRGDSLWYDRKHGLGKGFKNVMIIDTAQKVTITGDFATNNEITNTSLVTGHALFIQAFKKDSLFLHADTLKSITTRDSILNPKTKKYSPDTSQKSEKRKVIAYKKVRIYKTDLQGKCDSLSWTSADSTMHLYNDPVLWSDGNQLTADTVSILTAHGDIMQLHLRSNAFIVSKEDSTRYDQVKGKKMTGYFVKNELRTIFVDGNGQTIYYAKDKHDLIGVNRADCSKIKIMLQDQKVESISFYNRPDATLYPPNDLSPHDALLKDFRWRESEQPKSVPDLFVK